MITCFADCAAMRPKSIGGSGSTMSSPSSASGLIARASETVSSVNRFSGSSTTCRWRVSARSPVLRSISARMSYSAP